MSESPVTRVVSTSMSNMDNPARNLSAVEQPAFLRNVRTRPMASSHERIGAVDDSRRSEKPALIKVTCSGA
jgi:hypothetical protein